MRCVITAGPSAGKTSTLRELSARGYRTLPEAARILFDQAVSEGEDPEEIREADDFHEQVERVDRRIESQLAELAGADVFLDRSLADNIAYRRHFGNPVPDDLRAEVTDRYDLIFLLEQLPFEEDYARDEDADEAKELHATIRETYLDLGYDVVEVPVVPIDERVDLIETHL